MLLRILTYCRRALEISEHVDGIVDRRGPVYGVLAWALWQRGEMTEALDAARTSRTIIEPLVGSTFSSNLINALWREGGILGDPEEASLGRNDEAAAAFRRALAIAEGQAQKDRQDYLSRHNAAKDPLGLRGPPSADAAKRTFSGAGSSSPLLIIPASTSKQIGLTFRTASSAVAP